MLNMVRRFRKVVETDRMQSPEVRKALVETLFASPLSLLIGGLSGILASVASALVTGDPWIVTIAYVIPTLAMLRIVHCYWAKGLRTGEASRSGEFIYELGAWLYAFSIGALAILALVRTSDGQIHLLTSVVAVGYAAGICARNAARPAIAAGQLALSTLPLTIGLFLFGGTAYSVLGLISLLYIIGMASITAQTYRAVSNAVLNARRNAARWRETLDSIPQMVWSHAPDGSEAYYNRQWDEFTGDQLRSGLIRRIDLVHPDDRERVQSAWENCLLSGADYEAEYRIRRISGEYRWVFSRGRPLRDGGGDIIRWYGSCTDVHDRVLALRALNESETLNRGIIEASPDCVSLLDPSGTVLFANRAAHEAYGSGGQSVLLGRRWGAQIQDSSQDERERAIQEARRGGVGRVSIDSSTSEGEKRCFDALLAPVLDAAGRPAKIVVTSRDVTHQKKIEDEMRWRAAHDYLTTLPNRASFQAQLSERTAAADSPSFALLLLDVDNFKQVNDTQGHDAGDTLLRIVAERLQEIVRPDDFVARLGGDEFALILSGASCADDVGLVAARIEAGLKEPWTHNSRTADCRASIGASLFPDHGTHGPELLKNADIALYTAKAGGGGKTAVFEAGMRAEIQKQYSMISLASAAVRNDLILPFYQPKIDLQTGRVDGFEALLRWRGARGKIHGAETIAAAFEDLSLAANISDAMIDLVLEDVARWQLAGLPFGHVALNVAAAELRLGDFAERLLERLARASVPASSIQVEVTESVFMGRGSDYVERALRLLSANGVAVALDDFGTGFASLTHLKQFPVDIIKIDRSFIGDLTSHAEDTAIVQAVIGLGKSLGIKVVAEGIETGAQRRFLRDLGCPLGQGFLFGKAMSASAAEQRLGATAQARRLAA